jgi:hypothetical protein
MEACVRLTRGFSHEGTEIRDRVVVTLLFADSVIVTLFSGR